MVKFHSQVKLQLQAKQEATMQKRQREFQEQELKIAQM